MLNIACPATGHRREGIDEARIDRRETLVLYDYLSDVQREILWFLYRFKVASLQQIAGIFSNAESPRKRKQIVGRHLAGLVQNRFIEAHEPDPRFHYKHFFSLAPAGMYCCQVEATHNASRVRRIRTSKASAILAGIHSAHHLYIVDAMSGFVKAEQQGTGYLEFYGDKEVCYQFPYLGSLRRIMPDATCVWCTEDAAYNFWVELVNRQGSSREIVEKLQKYFYFSVAGNHPGDEFKREIGTNQFPVLLVVAVRRSQLPSLRQGIITGALESHIGTIPEIARRVVVALACLEDIKRDSVFEEVWEMVSQAQGLIGFKALFESQS